MDSGLESQRHVGTTNNPAVNDDIKSILEDVGECGLHRKTPYGITHVCQTQFSIARFCGAIKYNGDTFIYFPDTDELIREDVLSWKLKKKITAAAPARPTKSP